MNDLEERVARIEQRNKSVALDRAWEMSLERRLAIGVFTYLSIGGYMWAIQLAHPWLNAIIPTVGFMLSTLTLPWLKRGWLKSKMNRD